MDNINDLYSKKKLKINQLVQPETSTSTQREDTLISKNNFTNYIKIP